MIKYILILLVTLVFITGCGENATSPDRNDSEQLITHLSLDYPNPSSVVTTISFALAEDAWVKLEIFNIEGHRISVLIDEELQAGCYQVVWNGENASSGIYIAKLQANEYKYSKKITLF